MGTCIFTCVEKVNLIKVERRKKRGEGLSRIVRVLRSVQLLLTDHDRVIDLVIGKDHNGALVTIVERLTSYTVSTRINDKSAKTVTAATIALPFKEQVKTMTADNGKEFAYHEEITKVLEAPVYFADPYCSYHN